MLTNALGEMPSKDVIDDLNELLGRWGVLDELRSLPQGFNTVLTQNLIRSLSPVAGYAVMFNRFSALISADQASWTELLVYVIALRYAWISVRQVTARLTKLSQFFPEFEKLRDLVRAAERVDRSSRPKARASKEPILLVSRGTADLALGDDNGQIELQRGRPILVLHPDLIDRRALERLNITVWPRVGRPRWGHW